MTRSRCSALRENCNPEIMMACAVQEQCVDIGVAARDRITDHMSRTGSNYCVIIRKQTNKKVWRQKYHSETTL